MYLLAIKSKQFSLTAHHIALLKESTPALHVECLEEGNITDEQFRKATVICGWPAAGHLRIAENLQWLHIPSAGVENYTEPSIYHHKGIVVTRAKDVFSTQIAEHMIMLFLALGRDLATSLRSMEEHKWVRHHNQRELSGATVLIVGAGSIGNELAKKLSGFGCRIIGIKRDPSVLPPYYDEVYDEAGLDPWLPQADYVALCLPKTADTKDMFDYRRFALMKPEAIITNIGRGNAIVMDDINRALREGLIGGAGLDVTEPEPFPEGHPLWDAPNLIITSHTAGHSIHTNQRRFDMFYELWTRFTAGQPLHSMVDFSKGY